MPPGSRSELSLLDGAEQARADFGGRGNFVQRDTPQLALPPQAFSKRTYARTDVFKWFTHLSLARFFIESYEVLRALSIGHQNSLGDQISTSTSKVVCSTQHMLAFDRKEAAVPFR